MPLSDETELLREPDPREPYGRLFHEQGRLTVNAERAHPRGIGPWEERDPEQQETDMRGASAVAAKAVREAALDLAAARKQVMLLEADRERAARTLQDLARRADQAGNGYPDGSTARASEWGRAGAYRNAVTVIRGGTAGGEGGEP